MPPVFFLSYAREDGQHEVRRFYEELLESVRSKIGGSSAGMGFYDEQAIELGEQWPDELATALQGCEVFLPLYSPTFFSKPFCGKEWAVFRERQQRYAATLADRKLPPLVLPILWEAKQYLPAQLPEDFADLQFISPDTSAQYIDYGMKVLVKQAWREQARADVIQSIAHRIVTLRAKHRLPPLPNTPKLSEVVELFPKRIVSAGGGVADAGAAVAAPADAESLDDSEGGPRYVKLICVAASRAEAAVRTNQEFYGKHALDWRPYRPAENGRAGALAGTVINERDFISVPYEQPLDDAMLAHLQNAERDNQIVVLLVDTWTLRIQRYFDLMQRVDQGTYPNTSVLVIWDGDNETAGSQAKLDELVQYAFFNRSKNAHARVFVSPVKSPEEFKRQLGEALESARRRIREYADLKRKVAYVPRPVF